MASRRMPLASDLEAFAFQTLAFQLAGAADGFGLLAGALFGRLLVVTAKLHFTEDTLALHLLLERLESLIDVVVTNENLHVKSPLLYMRLNLIGQGDGPPS